LGKERRARRRKSSSFLLAYPEHQLRREHTTFVAEGVEEIEELGAEGVVASRS